MIYNTVSSLLNNNLDLKKNLSNYLSSDLLNELYFKPKKVDKKLINEKLDNPMYLDKVINAISTYKDVEIEKYIYDKLSFFQNDISYKINDYKIYVIIGLDTTTIYSIKYNGEDVTVLLLESTNGSIDDLNILLAHEFTHFVRKDVFKRDIFENSIGERFVVEGIGCSYSKEVVPKMEDYIYCIVNKDTFNWVKNNISKVEKYMNNKISSNELMKDFFYMFVDTQETGMPARVGYVYGYLKIQEYLEKNNLKVKDIIDKDWKCILKVD